MAQSTRNPSVRRRISRPVAALVLAASADLVTFLVFESLHGPGVELNGLAMWLLGRFGITGVVALKVAAIALVLVLTRLAGRAWPAVRDPILLFGAGMCAFGALANVAAVIGRPLPL